MSEFFHDFFVADPMYSSAHDVPLVFSTLGNQIFQFLDLKEAFQVASCSKFYSNIVITSSTATSLLKSTKNVNKLGVFQLSIESAVSIGKFRKLLVKLVRGYEACIVLDDSGDICLDMGNLSDQYITPELEQMAPFDFETSPRIEKFLEKASFDEYDDFNPRHPECKDKLHKRGDSYFNSDIGNIASEALNSLDFAFDSKP